MPETSAPPPDELLDPLRRREPNSVQSGASSAWPDGPNDLPIYDAETYTALWIQIASEVDDFPGWSIYPGRRDRLLRRFWKTEPIVAGALYSLVARIKSIPHTITSSIDEELAVRFQEEILNYADLGRGFNSLKAKTLVDLLTQDNGFFWELEGPGDPNRERLGNILTGIHHLDSGQCFRTFDPEYPVLYVNPIDNSRHRMHYTRIYSSSNMPQPNETARGIGFCPLSRGLQQIQLARAILQYRYEKVSGKFKRGIISGKGTTKKTLGRVLDRIESQEEVEGLVTFNGMPVLISVEGIELNLLDLASLPDNFDLETEITLYVYIMSLAFGVDAREFWPATSAGATKADASVQHMKAKGKGLADVISEIEFAINSVAWESISVTLDHVDDEHDQQVATLHRTVVDTYSILLRDGVISQKVYQAEMLKQGIIDANLIQSIDSIEELAVLDDLQEVQDEIALERQEEFFGDEENLEEEDEEESDETASDDEDKTVITYRRSLRSTLSSFWLGHSGFLDLLETMTNTVTRHLTRAWYAGFAEFGIKPGEISEEEMLKLQRRLQLEYAFVIPFVNDVFQSRETGGSVSPFRSRIDMWANRWDEVKSQAMTLAGSDLKFRWVVDPAKEHCIDCIRLHDRVYRGRVWEKWNLKPRSADLACFGGRCGCEFVKTDAPVTKGRPPNLVGPKSKRRHKQISARKVRKLLQLSVEERMHVSL